uniref:Phosphatidate cytidylyltransferase, mitochondrial n=1 Tax=Strongyloides venezuelensis TaxID=75913 RepID=A0A0K0G0K8_STRVS
MSEYLELIKCIPLDTADYVCAYGSGALSQAGENINEKMVDFIVVTNDPLNFHKNNMNQNPNHYFFLHRFWPHRIAKIQTSFGARVYYISNVKSNGRMIKYGVISTYDALQDLLDWRWLYISGRLQKPVLNVIAPTKELAEAIENNRISALHFALLKLGDTFTYEDLFKQIVSISYNGDFRQKFGEDRNKIDKIVRGGYDRFVNIYKPLLLKDNRVTILSSKIEQDNTTEAVYHRLNLLPSEILNNLQDSWKKRYKVRRDIEEILFSLSHRLDADVIISKIAKDIVYKSAISQSWRNVCSAGPYKSIVYSYPKLLKFFKSIR